MENIRIKTAILGAGTIGTSLGNLLAETGKMEVVLHTIESDVAEDITCNNINSKYFPAVRLDRSLKAFTNPAVLESSGVIFLALPSTAILSFLNEIRPYIPPDAILVNLAKGFGDKHRTITSSIKDRFPNPVCTLKGPSFARDIVNHVPTAFTIAAENEAIQNKVAGLFTGTYIYLDHSDDIEGVELLSILKNIYSIAMGIVDAHYDSPNIRFLILTRAFREMHQVLIRFGGKEETIFKYCGIGDFTLTALNDLSRNRTLGLLIGKGFFKKNISHDLVLEGVVATNVFYTEISKICDVRTDFPIIYELYRIFNEDYTVTGFVRNLLRY
jgi:glycerol-3-phosphate dehydrogenase (NAD(P)+)